VRKELVSRSENERKKKKIDTPSGTGLLPLFVSDEISELIKRQVRSHRHRADRSLNLSFKSLEEAKPHSMVSHRALSIHRKRTGGGVAVDERKLVGRHCILQSRSSEWTSGLS
jgi:hypothetical protein